MFKIKTLNKISSVGLLKMPLENYEVGSEIATPDAIILRSFKMHGMELPASLKAVARAGSGVNNIPVEACSQQGIVVFNTPGANANAVKEIVFAALLLSSRKLAQSMLHIKSWAGKGEEISKLVEKEKGAFAGQEIKGKTLGIIGLGAVGSLVAHDAVALGMRVKGYDPFISVERAWGLTSAVERILDLGRLLQASDYVTLHIPLTDETKHLINAERLSQMKKGARLINFSRGEIVDDEALKKAMGNGTVACYVTDFPNDTLLQLQLDNVLCLPHLGASTQEAEDNCAVMAVEQTMDFLEYGNITNAVNFPACQLEPSSPFRLLIASRNIPNMVGQISALLHEEKLPIVEMLNRSREEIAYTMIDLQQLVEEAIVQKIRSLEGVLQVRYVRLPKLPEAAVPHH